MLFVVKCSYWSCRAGNDPDELDLTPDRITARAIASFGTKDLPDPEKTRKIFQQLEKKARHVLDKHSRPLGAASAHFVQWVIAEPVAPALPSSSEPRRCSGEWRCMSARRQTQCRKAVDSVGHLSSGRRRRRLFKGLQDLPLCRRQQAEEPVARGVMQALHMVTQYGAIHGDLRLLRAGEAETFDHPFRERDGLAAGLAEELVAPSNAQGRFVHAQHVAKLSVRLPPNRPDRFMQPDIEGLDRSRLPGAQRELLREFVLRRPEQNTSQPIEAGERVAGSVVPDQRFDPFGEPLRGQPSGAMILLPLLQQRDIGPEEDPPAQLRRMRAEERLAEGEETEHDVPDGKTVEQSRVAGTRRLPGRPLKRLSPGAARAVQSGWSNGRCSLVVVVDHVQISMKSIRRGCSYRPHISKRDESGRNPQNRLATGAAA